MKPFLPNQTESAIKCLREQGSPFASALARRLEHGEVVLFELDAGGQAAMRRLVLVEIEAATPLDAEALVGRALVGVAGRPFVHQTLVTVASPKEEG